MKSDINVETFTINDVSTELEVYLNLTFGKVFYCLGFLWLFYMCCTGRAGNASQSAVHSIDVIIVSIDSID